MLMKTGSSMVVERIFVNIFKDFYTFYDCLIIRNVREFGSFLKVFSLKQREVCNQPFTF